MAAISDVVSPPANDSLDFAHDVTDTEAARDKYKALKALLLDRITPWILAFGILGNVLCITVLSRRRVRRGSGRLERCAVMGFLFLAISDFLFCVTGFPQGFFKAKFFAKTSDVVNVISVVYSAYKAPLLNLFVFSSTWSTVLIAFERYLVVVNPLKSRIFVRPHRTVVCQLSVIIFAIVCNIPKLLEPQLTMETFGNETYVTLTSSRNSSDTLMQFYRVTSLAWNVLATLLPFTILLFCYINLLLALHRSGANGQVQMDKNVTSKITVILVAIMTLYFVFVCPALAVSSYVELKFFEKEDAGTPDYSTLSALVVTNTLLCVNFSVNFLLYFSMNKSFRRVVTLNRCRGDDVTSSLRREGGGRQEREVIHLRIK